MDATLFQNEWLIIETSMSEATVSCLIRHQHVNKLSQLFSLDYKCCILLSKLLMK